MLQSYSLKHTLVFVGVLPFALGVVGVAAAVGVAGFAVGVAGFAAGVAGFAAGVGVAGLPTSRTSLITF